MPQPLKTIEEPVRLSGAVSRLPRAYIYCTRKLPDDVFAQFSTRVKNADGWSCRGMDADHRPNATAPQKLAELIDAMIGAGH